jgi:hypothetical protein
VSLVKRGTATDKTIRDVFYWACKQTRCGRDGAGSGRNELFNLSHGGNAIVRGFNLDAFIDPRTAIPDAVAFRVDTTDWLDSLPQEKRQRALDLAEGRSTQECAKRWHVSEAAVSQTRRYLERSYRRFIAD